MYVNEVDEQQDIKNSSIDNNEQDIVINIEDNTGTFEDEILISENK